MASSGRFLNAPTGPLRPWAMVAAGLLPWVALSHAATNPSRTATPAGGSIYTCTDGSGRAHTSDRPIAACFDREQIERNRDGTVRRVVPPSMSVLEIEAEQERRRREQLRLEEARQRQRADKLLLSRYPDDASHYRARAAALEAPEAALRSAQARLTDLQADRERLHREAEFYEGRALPMSLQQQFDANEAAISTQRAAVRNQQAEIDRVNANFDTELLRLNQLRSSSAR